MGGWGYSGNLFQILEIAEIKVGNKANYCLNVFLGVPNNMDPNKYVSMVIT